jgi:hypothetical protein
VCNVGMSPLMKNVAFYSAFAFALLVFAVGGCVFAFFMGSPGPVQTLAGLPAHPWWFLYRTRNAVFEPLWTLGAVMLAAPLASVFALRARALFGREPAPLVTFFVLYLFTLCLEGLRVPSAFLYATDRSVAASVVLSRAVYGARFAGHLFLLAAGLYALELKYKRTLILTAFILITSLAIASYIPMDSTVFLSSLTYRLGDEWGVWFAENCLGILAAAAMAGAALSKGKTKFYLLAGASFAIFGGRQMLYFSGPPPLLAAGLVLLVAGVTTFLRTLLRLYRGVENA